MARPSKPYHVKDNNKPVPGLSRGKDGRWRFQLNGKDVKFSEPDANKAVNRYLRVTGQASTVVAAGPHGAGNATASAPVAQAQESAGRYGSVEDALG